MTNKILNQLFSSCKKWKTLVLISMLLTLGTGQMWAKVVYYNDGGASGTPRVYYWNGSPSTSWDGCPSMVHISGNIYGCDIGTNTMCIFRYNNASSQTSNLSVPTDSKNYYNSTTWSALSTFSGGATLYLLVNNNWKQDNARFAACFLGINGQTWVDCSQVGTSDYYSVTIPSGEWPYVIFCRMNPTRTGDNNGNNWDSANKWNQTSDLAPSSGKNGVEITGWDNSSNWIVVYTGLSVTYTPTAAANAPTITNNQTVAKSTTSITVNAQNANTGYRWVNWTSSNGTFGTATNQSTTFTPTASNAVAQANYDEKRYTVTVNNDGNGTTTPSGAQSNVGQITGIAISATPSTNYEFVDWEIISGTGSFASSTTTNSNTFYPTSAATIRANFRSTLTYSLTVAKGSGISSVTGSTSPVTLGSKYAISATPSTGYTFGGWTASPAANGTFDNASNASTNVTVKNGSVTVTGAATENMTTVTVNVIPTGAGTLTVDASAFTPGNTTTAGVTTSRAVVATAANDYTFDNWTTGGNATGTASTNTYTLEGNGNGSTGTLTANFTPIPVKLLYGNATPLNSPTDGGAMSYDATEHAYYIDVTTNSSPYYFRFDYNSNSEQYSGNWTSYPNVVEATGDGTKVDCNQTVKGWENKASIKYSGASGSSIRVWFDFQNKKAWVTETTYTVSVAASAGGSVSPSSVTGVGATTASGDITATPSTGYLFTGWTLPDGTSAAAGYTASSNPIHINATAASKTITANFAAATAFIEGRFHVTNSSRNGTWTNTFGSGQNWNENSVSIKFTWDGTNSRYYLHTYATPKELTQQLSGYDPYFYIKESSSSSTLANVVSYWSANSQTLTAAGTGNKKSLVSSGTFNNANLRFNSDDESGYTVLYFDEAGVWYELEQTLTYDANGGTGSAPATAYYLKGTNATAAAANTFSRTGYTFAGWKTGKTTGTDYAAGADVPMNSNITLYAQWNANNYTITLDKQSGATGYGGDGTVTNPTVTYDGDLPALSGTMPSGTGSYGFMGFYSKAGGAGTKFINADGTWAVTDVTDTVSNGKWVYDGAITLYAYYKVGTISELVLSEYTVAPETEGITVTPTFSPKPAGSYIVCYEIRYSNGTALSPQPSMSTTDDVLTFTAPKASATYIVHATLRAGSSCGAGDVLSEKDQTFQVAGEHTVTVLYHDADGRTIAASGEVTGKPLEWSDDITAPTITGYTFARWDAGDGVTIKDGDDDGKTSTTATIKIKAIYDGTLTAVYTKKRMIYFYNTLGWSSVTVYFYKNNKYWGYGSDDGKGTGSSTSWEKDGTHPFDESGLMTQITGTNIWYYDCEANEINSSYSNVAFTEYKQDNYTYFSYKFGTTTPNKVARREDYKSTLPMFVPIEQDGISMNGGQAYYYSDGYWMNYPENTGYTLKIYDAWNASQTSQVREYEFPFSEDKTMPLKLNVEFNNGGAQYWFMVYRNDGTYWGNTYTFNQNYNTEQKITSGVNKSKLVTSAAGIYTLTLTYHKDGSNNLDYYIDVDFPVAVGDYRILYKDQVAWSGAAHAATWNHPSDIIRMNSGESAKKDTVSLFVKVDENTSAKFQYASAIDDNGTITWTDVTNGTIDLSGITSDGVYNFIVNQPAGGASISLLKTEAYSGNFYIRTDCAGSTKWDSYHTLDHQMTFSDYTKDHEGYSHYYAHWVERSTNVQFVIANDYSPCVSDTLIKDVGIDFKNMDDAGTLKTDGSSTAFQDKYSANIRFMYNEETNKLSRAYLASSTDVSKKFLVMRGNSAASTGHIFTEDGKELTDAAGGQVSGLDEYEMNFADDQNFIYETTIKANPTALVKLYAKYCGRSQEFKGDTTGTFDNSHAIEILGGTYAADTKEKMRIVYDFKTNRLVCAWLPSGDITGDLDINADVMIIREHQGDAQQIKFTTNESKLDEVKTVYGVMRFNRWTLNNKDKSTHDPVGDPKSQYERALYWISFPFDVNLSDVFGFGTYGEDWIIEYYDGASRAANGYWIDSPSFWRYVWPAQRATFKLEAGKGYVLALDLDRMKDNNTSFWTNNIEQIELFFPSATEAGSIKETEAIISVAGHECTIDRRTDKTKPDVDKDRTRADSHWNMIGIPSYANYGTTITSDGSSAVITWNSNPYTNDLPFLYEWNMVDDSYTVQSGSTYPFKSMHAYMVQYHGDMHWSLASATPTPSPIVARRAYAQAPQEVEFKLELQQNEQMVDQTFVKLSDKEEVSANFNFDEDLFKEFNNGKANVYTLVESYIPAAGNILPLSEQTTLVPVGVKTNADGDYTFSMPNGTDGVGVTLIDNVRGMRTNLALSDYMVELEAGTYDDRFVLEISPIEQIVTNVELINGENGDAALNGVCKKLIDGVLYIVKDGKVFDARGARIQ